MPGIPGTLLQPTVGSIVGVAFLDGDPAQPRAVTWDQTTPVSVGLAGGGAAVHRVGDGGTAGVLTAPAALVLTTPSGAIATISGMAGMVPVVFQINLGAGPFTIDTRATEGSDLVTCGG
jgi:hypothetical protein